MRPIRVLAELREQFAEVVRQVHEQALYCNCAPCRALVQRGPGPGEPRATCCPVCTFRCELPGKAQGLAAPG